MAISLTRTQAVYRAFAMAAPGRDEEAAQLSLPDIEEMLDEAARKVCDLVAGSANYHRVQNLFLGVTISSGTVTLDDSIIPDTIRQSRGGRVTSSAFAYPLVQLRNFRDAALPKPVQGSFGFFVLRGGNSSGGQLWVYNADGTAMTGTVDILACQYQTYANLAPQLEDEFLDVLGEIIKMKLMNPAQVQSG